MTMHNFFRCVLLGLVCLLATSYTADANELYVNLRIEHASFLQFERVIAFVSLRNETETVFYVDNRRGQRGRAAMRFVIEKKRDEPVAVIRNKPLVKTLRIEPGETREVMVNISSHYDLAATGRYIAMAVIDWDGRMFRSNKVMLDVITGLEMTSVVRSVPGYPRTVRKYALRYWPRGGAEYIFLRIDEEKTSLNYGVFQLGRLIRVFEPILEVDRSGNVKVLHQSGRDRYTQSTFKSSRDKVRFVDQDYYRSDGEPYVASQP